MKFLIVVLAVASLCLAEPEADPSFLYGGYYPYTTYAAAYYNPYVYVRPAIANGYGYTVPGGVTHVNRLDKREAEADAHVLVANAYSYTPYVYSPYFAYGPYSCVTAEGCAVQNLRHSGLAKREAEADPSFLYTPYAYGAYNLYNAYPYNYYSYVPRVAPVVAQVNKAVTFEHLGAHPVQPTTVVETTNHVVGHTFVKREAEAEADAHFVYPAYAYNNLYNPYYNAYYPYNYYTYVPQVAPVVAQVNKPVTYTHLGAHPLVNPSTVVETENHIVGSVVV